MSFFFVEKNKSSKKLEVRQQTLNALRCKACPRNKDQDIRSPKMKPKGKKDPLVYILGDKPLDMDDRLGGFFESPEGRLLKQCLPGRIRRRARFNNTIRCWGGADSAAPEYVVTECCRPWAIEDIEKSKPKIIIGVGEDVLRWLTGETSIYQWRGRKLPVKVGKHICWLYPVNSVREIDEYNKKSYKTTMETDFGILFKNDIARIARDLDDLEDAKKFYTPDTGDHKITYVYGQGADDAAKVETALKAIQKEKCSAFDFETNCLRPYRAGATILSIAISSSKRTIAIGLNHPQSKWPRDKLVEVQELLLKYFNNKKHRKIAQNLSFDMEWIAVFYSRDWLHRNKWGDTQAQAYCLDERKRTHNLDFLTMQHFGVRLKGMSDVSRQQLELEPIEEVLKYNALDSFYTRKLYFSQLAQLKKEDLVDTYNLQLVRIPALILSQIQGIQTDPNVTKRLSKMLEKRFNSKLDQILKNKDVKKYIKRTQQEFNPLSNQQLTNFFKYMKIFKKGEAINVRASTLKDINHVVAKMVPQLRSNNKLKSTYVDNILPGVGKDIWPDGLVHTQFNSLLTSTGRLSSEDPNIQNIPKHKNSYVRKQFVPPRQHIIVSIDYGQIEARLIAMASKDKVLCQALWDRYDIHMDWAKRIHKEYPEWSKIKKPFKDKDESKRLRQLAKNKAVFPLFFGARDKSVASYLNIPLDVAQKLTRDFWKMFEGVKEWQDKMEADYKKKGYVATLTGRRRHAPMSPNELINMPIQGCASDIVVDAQTRLSKKAEIRDYRILQPVLNIHDDLTFYIHTADFVNPLNEIIKTMLDVPFDFVNVPITVEVSFSPENLYNMQSLDDFSSDQNTELTKEHKEKIVDAVFNYHGVERKRKKA